MKEYTTVFHLIKDVTNAEGAVCVLIGGFAVNYYKVGRQTADVDFLITKEDFEKIIGLLKQAGYKLDYAHRFFVQLKSNEETDLMDLDFMFVDKETMHGIIKDGQKVKIAGQEFIVPSLNHLIALKLHSLKHNFKFRENRDLPDIIELVRINKMDIKSKKFQELCSKYGTEEIYRKIKERME